MVWKWWPQASPRQVSPLICTTTHVKWMDRQVDIWTFGHSILLHVQGEILKSWTFKKISFSRLWIIIYVTLYSSFKNTTFKVPQKGTSTKISWKGYMNIIKILQVFSIIPSIYIPVIHEDLGFKNKKSSRFIDLERNSLGTQSKFTP